MALLPDNYFGMSYPGSNGLLGSINEPDWLTKITMQPMTGGQDYSQFPGYGLGQVPGAGRPTMSGAQSFDEAGFVPGPYDLNQVGPRKNETAQPSPFRPGSLLDRMFGIGQPQPQMSGASSFDEAGFITAAQAPQPAAQSATMPRPIDDISARSSQFGPGMTRNAPSDLGFQYGPGGEPAWQASGQEASIPPNARLAQGQYQQAPPQAEAGPGVMDRLAAGATNFTTGGNPIAGLFNSISGLATGRRTDSAGIAQSNQANMARALYGALTQRGIPQEQALAIAQAAATDPKMAETLLPQALGLKPPETMEGHFARQADRAANGSGQGASAPMPQYYDHLRRKSSSEKAGTTEGERVATAQLDLPGAVAQSQEALRLIGELRNHKGRDQLGWHDVFGAAPLVPSTKGYDAQKILDQLKGGAFLEAFKALKGGGQITEVEGKKATDAIARMDRAQSKGEFEKALTDYEGVIRLGIDRANQQAGEKPPHGFRGNSEWQPAPGKPGVRIRQVQ